MLSLRGPFPMFGRKDRMQPCLPASPRQALGRRNVWELREPDEGRATKQTEPQAWLLVMSELRAQRRDCFPSVILPHESETRGTLGLDYCRLPRSPPVHLPFCSSPPRLLPLTLIYYLAPPLSITFSLKQTKKQMMVSRMQ